ncbi:hypothetical protein [Nocardia blacklockiae]|uniref:hypothetical protein n=1 Tax=Nocardia blacklockiae TaxID=480036 RepID=UPI001895B0E6|nr:hypothetical protein [Nocardia blacklockiae]MBF6176603.1 hypothetical protein [Nocardia blacklockiae]
MRTQRPADVDEQLLGLRSEAWWSPADHAYIAYSMDFPALVCSDPWSSLAAINKLEDRIRHSLNGSAPTAA